MAKFLIETGHTLEELQQGDHWDNACWDFSAEDFFSGAIEPQDNMVYWLIDGRVYETTYVIDFCIERKVRA